MPFESLAIKEQQISASTEARRVIVICGSMAHFDSMLQLQRQLSVYGIDSITPEDERHFAELCLSELDWAKMKRRMSERYFRSLNEAGTAHPKGRHVLAIWTPEDGRAENLAPLEKTQYASYSKVKCGDVCEAVVTLTGVHYRQKQPKVYYTASAISVPADARPA
jgi:hypothetical protein